ncbi:MAG: NADP-dependent oxidoreductase [Azospirillaceae bacterium]|nr:NADP-dependent oxidoreductase [Azospirillaceae bacterium]
MKAFQLPGYNLAPAWADIPEPVAGPGEVLVRIKAAALNPLDLKLQTGAMQAYFPLAFPYTQASDFSGTVEQVGAGVGQWRVGDQVVGRTPPPQGGALASLIAVSADLLAPAPKSLPLVEAAGIPTAAATAWQALFEVADLKPGQTVLVHASAGGVGSFAVQFARARGARVIATASGTGLDMVRALGADQVIDHRSEDFAARVTDVDVVLDTIGGETQQRSFAVLRQSGILVAAASPPNEALAKAHNVRAAFVFLTLDGARLAPLVAMVDDQPLTVLIDRVVPSADVEQAFQHLASGRAKGKIIVTIS